MTIRTWTDEQLIKAVVNSTSFRQVAQILNLSTNGTSCYRTIKQRINELCLNISHFKHSKKNLFTKKIPTELILTVDSLYYHTFDLKQRLFKENILENKCYECGISSWRNKPLSLHLDHINGIRTDNRLENLRILCPNCHSQTETYAGKKNNKQKSKCLICGEYKKRKSKKCITCHLKIITKNQVNQKQYKFQISKEELEKLVWEKPTSQIAKMFGVSDNTITKRCKKLGITKPGRGYWEKVYHKKI